MEDVTQGGQSTEDRKAALKARLAGIGGKPVQQISPEAAKAEMDQAGLVDKEKVASAGAELAPGADEPAPTA